MGRPRILAMLRLALCLAVALGFAQQGSRGNRWAMYESEMQHPVDDPPDAWEKTEFAFARLRFRSYRDGGRWFRARWGTDANKSERQFIQGLRRLTRIHARSVEQIVDIDSDEIYDWPFLYAVGVGDWTLSDAHATRLRNFFERGGFLMVDDFHNEREWGQFMAGIHRIFPAANVVELGEKDPIFNIVYQLKPEHVPGYQVVWGQEWERQGYGHHYRAVVDDKNRVQVAMFFNQDFGDAWEWADDPRYPERYASQAYRVGVNYVIYTMTH